MKETEYYIIALQTSTNTLHTKTLNPKLNQTIVNTRSNIHVTFVYLFKYFHPSINQKTTLKPQYSYSLVPKINSSNFTKYFPILLSRLKTFCHEFQRVYNSRVYYRLDTPLRFPPKRNRRSRFKVFHIGENVGKSNRLGGRERRHNICSVKSA